MKTLTIGSFSAKDGYRFRQRNPGGGGQRSSPHRVDPKRRSRIQSVRTLLMSVTFTLLSGLAVPGMADDIAIYFPYHGDNEAGATRNPNILFMLDNSGSMNWAVEGGRAAVGERRIDYLRQALTETLDEIQGVNVGLGRFTQLTNFEPNAPIIFPIMPIDTEMEDEEFKTTNVLVPIAQSQDDAMENTTSGKVSLTDPTLFVSTSGTAAGRSTTITVGSSSYQIRFESHEGNTWRYSVKELGGTDLKYWIIESATCDGAVTAHDESPSTDTLFEGEEFTVLNPETGQEEVKTGATYSEGIGWQTAPDFSEGNFSVTLDQDYPEGLVNVIIKEGTNTVVTSTDKIIGPNCGSDSGTGSGTDDTGGSDTGSTGDSGSPYNAIIENQWSGGDTEKFQFSFLSVQQNTDNTSTWTYSGKKLQGNLNPIWFLETGNCKSKIGTIYNEGKKSNTGDTGIRWPQNDSGNFSFTLKGIYPAGIIKIWAWASGKTNGTINEDIPATADIIGPVCDQVCDVNKTNEGCSIYDAENSSTGGSDGHAVTSSCYVPDDDGNKMEICHIPDGQPENAHTIEISKSAWPTHRDAGDLPGKCLKEQQSQFDTNSKKVAICHYPPGNPDNVHKIEISIKALKTHLDHHSDTIYDSALGCEGPQVICPESQIVGLRFEHIDIPKGATIKNARIEFTSAAAVDGSATFTINAENIGDALAFDDTDDHNISSRTTFEASRNVSWSVNSWNSGMTYPTDELSTLVQSVVNHNNWCGGNSLAFIIEGDSSALHRVFSYDGDPSSAPKLNIEFDPPESGTGCMNQSYFGAITNEEDDAEQKTDGQVFNTTEGDTLDVGFGESGATDLRTIGLRFRNVPIRPSATIKSAHLIFHAQAGNNDDNAEFTIEGQLSPNSEPFNEDINRDVSDRPKVKVGSSVKSISWPVTKSWEPGKAYRSPDITSLVQEMVQQEGWNAGTNSMTFIVTGESGQRQVYSSEAGTTTAPTLHVQIEGYLGQMDTRAHLKKTVASLTPSAWTPIVDALYESAIYFRGSEVFYGKDRQNRYQNLLSHPSTYTHVTPLAADTPKVETPNGCNVEVDPFSWKCKGEKITETSSSKPVYTSPIKLANSPCQTNHVVLLTDGVATRNNSVNEVQALIGESCQTIWDGFEEMASNSECDDNRCEKCGISLAKFLHEEDQYDDPDDSSDDMLKNTVTTHTIGFMLKNQHAVEYMTKMAEMGGGNFYPVDDATQLKEAFTSIIVSAMQESTSFAPAGISINRYNRLVHNNEVFFALFKPAMTRSWAGNVKKFKFAQVPVSNPASQWCDRNSTSASGTTVLCLVDQDGNVAVENQYISSSARSFWSPQVDGPDVITGGAGGLLSTNTNRKVLTYVGSGPDYPATLRDISTLDTGVLESAGLTGVDKEDNPLTANLLRNWVLGQKTNGEARDWLMAEPIHSSPQAISYAPVTTNTDGTKNSSVTKIFVGTNDGLVRMFDGETGSEEWAFLPQELFGIQADLMNNTADYAGTEHIYGMDTTPAFWINDQDGIIDPADDDFVRMFLGQRRGGSNYYALDVTGSSRDSQGSPPKLMWVIKGGVDYYFQRLGQTWSFASPVKVDPSYCSARDEALLESDGSCIVLLFGGGYDVSQDDDNNFGNSGIGNAIYMVHAKTGERLWWASSYATGGGNLMLGEMNYSIPSNLTVLDTNGDRWIDRLYVGDVAGQLWRIELLGKDEDGTDLTLGDRLAVVSAVDTSGVVAADSGRNAKRRFFNSPDWTKTDIGELVTIASGTRPDPLGTGVQERFYVFIDKGWIINEQGENTGQLATISENDMVNVEQLETQSVVDADDHGWFRELPGEGEKALGSPLVTKLGDKKVVLFTTYTPSPPSGVCDFQEGISRLYALNLLTGGPAFNTNKHDENCTGDNCPENFDTDDNGDDMSDSSIVIGGGLIPDVSTYFSKDKISALVGTEIITIDDDRGLQRTFWLQVDDVD